jgi:hypothetical protein
MTTDRAPDSPLSPEHRALLALPHRPPMRLVEEVLAIGCRHPKPVL